MKYLVALVDVEVIPLTSHLILDPWATDRLGILGPLHEATPLFCYHQIPMSILATALGDTFLLCFLISS
jgi:hypothetical protein